MNLKKHIIYSLSVAVILLCGCSDDPFGKNNILANGKIRMAISLQTPSGGSVTTRATDLSASEKSIHNAVVMVFDQAANASAELLQTPAQATINDNSLSVDLIPQENCFLCIVANISSTHMAQLLALDPGTLYSAIQSLKIDIDKNAANVGTFTLLPMNGWSDKISISSTTGNVNIPLSRSVARIDVDGTPNTPSLPDGSGADEFIVAGARLVNAAPSGYIFQQSTLPIWDATQVVTYDMINNSENNPVFKEKMYCFENKGMIRETPHPARVVVYGRRQGISTSTWYPIDIIYNRTLTENGITTTSKAYDIERNKIYTIRFNKVEKEGYRTYEEAVKSEAFNTMVDAEIIVSDPYAHDIVTNGRQYLGVTNAEFVVYPAEPEKEISNLHIATLSYTCDPNWQDGSITCSPGISLVRGSTPRLSIRGDAMPTYRDIVVDVASKITEGIITIQVGNLLKEIYVRVGEAVSPVGTILNNYFVASNDPKDFKAGEIINASAETAWLKVSPLKEDVGESSLSDKITNPDGGVYLHVQPNIGFEVAARTREASAYIAGDQDNQRIKITVQQNGYDVYSDKKQIKPFTYVGTFHRWNQTGERLIRINGSQVQGNDGGMAWWKATVVAGREFIVLDTERSPDSKIHIYKDNGTEPNPYGEGDDPGFTQTDEATEQYQVASRLRSVEGTSSYVYFRVGLTGKLSGPAAQPRYGLITLTYGSSPDNIYGTHNIYVRQGEAADYLMRPWDASTTPRHSTTGDVTRPNEFVSSTRPKAAKFGVYNLTDPTPDIKPLFDRYVDRGTRGYTFTQYPSQGGYLFITRGTVAVDPRNREGYIWGVQVPTLDDKKPWLEDWESCPKGYRRPGDGNMRPIEKGQGSTPDDIINSEVRQSLWLYPLHGAERSDFSNQLTGYIADGFFDRHPIVDIESPDIPGDKPKGIVRKGASDAAYCGYLLFNPNNYASIFVPFSGFYRTATAPGCYNFGGEGYMLTNTLLSYSGWIVAFGYISTAQTDPVTGEKYVFDNYSATSHEAGYAVRCIKNELPPAITDSTDVEIPTEGEGSGMMVANISYNSEEGTLLAAITARYPAESDRKRIGTVAVNAVKGLTAADYTFLNEWATASGTYAGHHLHHLVIRGALTAQIPASAFASAGWYSISLPDTKNIAQGAFTSGLIQLGNLSLSYPYEVEVAAGAFGFETGQVQLHLGGKSYADADITGKTWKSYQWKSIKRY